MAPIRCCFDQTAVWHSDAARGPSTPSFDHLVGAAEERDRDCETERLGGLHVDDEFDFRRLLHRQVRRVLALEDAAGVDATETIRVPDTASVAHQAWRSASAASCSVRLVKKGSEPIASAPMRS